MKKILVFVTLLLLSSCAKEEFATPKTGESINTPNVDSVTSQQCAQFTYIRPPVDLLFVWDNSTSTTFISNQTKSALNDVVNYISDRFDYHVMLSPLLGSGNNESYFFSREGLTPSGVTTISKDIASNYVGNFTRQSGSQEAGLTRVSNLIKNNQSNGVFRKNAYTLVIVMSNDDDNAWYPDNTNYEIPGNHTLAQNYMKGKVHDLLCMRGNYDGSYYNADNSTFNAACSNVGNYKLDSTMMRMLSITAGYEPKSYSCPQITLGKKNWVYRGASELIFGAPYTNLPSSNPYPFYPGSVVNQDQVDICNTSFGSIFDAVNNAITDAVIAHEYNFWPIAAPSQLIDENTIMVTRGNGQAVEKWTGSGSGWEYVGVMYNKNTRYAPTVGEPYSGHMLRLRGSARVTYPECLIVDFQTPKNYYGYIHLASKPQVSSITVKINGQTISQSSTNGWQVVTQSGQPEYKTNFNIKITSPNDYTPATPALIKSGYFLKLYGNAVYSDGAQVDVNYYPTGN